MHSGQLAVMAAGYPRHGHIGREFQIALRTSTGESR